MRSFTSLIIVVLLIIIALAVTKPDREHFNRWISDQIESPSDSGFLDKLIEKGFELQASQTLNYEDHVVYATATARIGNKRMEFLGVAGRWFQVGEDPPS